MLRALLHPDVFTLMCWCCLGLLRSPRFVFFGFPRFLNILATLLYSLYCSLVLLKFFKVLVGSSPFSYFLLTFWSFTLLGCPGFFFLPHCCKVLVLLYSPTFSLVFLFSPFVSKVFLGCYSFFCFLKSWSSFIRFPSPRFL